MSRATKIAIGSGLGVLAFAAVCVVALLVFDWNRAKPWIENRVTEATGRSFAIQGDLSLTWHAPQDGAGWRAWAPWPRLKARDVVLGNPEWAHAPRMARVREMTFSVNPLPLINHKIVIPSLALDTPRVHLERLADGRNNWTFKKKTDDPSVWRLDLQRLALNQGVLEWRDGVNRARLQLDIDTLEREHPDYGIRWRVSGTYNGEPVSGHGRAGSVLALHEANAPYPIDANLKAGKTTVVAQGTLTEPADLAALDLKLKLAGVSLAHLYPLTGMVLPETRPFTTEGRLVGTPRRGDKQDASRFEKKGGGHWRYENFTGKVGVSDLSGTLHYHSRPERPLLEGAVVSKLLHFQDLAPLIGADSNASRAQRGIKTVQPENKVLPVESFKTDRWTSIDADVQFTGRRIIHQQELPIDNLVTRMHLKDGVLSLSPLKFGVAGGSLVSSIRLDGRAKPMKAEMRLSARHLKLKELFPTLQTMRSSLGEINGNAALSGRGSSVAALLGSASGDIRMVINQGTISKFLLEAAGLNIGSVIVTQLFGDKQVPVECALSDFAIKQGVMNARAFVIDTRDATIYVKGDIKLAQEQLALTILPESKGVRVISLRTPLYVTGPFRQPEVDVNRGLLALKAGSAVALGVLAPVASALIPLVNVGPGEKSPCGTLLAQANERGDAPALAGSKERTPTQSSGQ